ncbi:MAG: JAB domain-containing protein [Bacteroidota bacterium]
MPPFVNYVTLKRRFSVPDALARYGALDQMRESVTGQLKGPCPIHQSAPTSTAFKVTPSLRGFRCFGCGAKGNVLDFVAAMEGIGVHDAALLIQEWLEEDSGDARWADSSSGDSSLDVPSPGVSGRTGEGRGGEKGRTAYEAHVFSGLPLYSSRLVRETPFVFDDLVEASTPGALFAFLRPYFADRDREEFVVVLFNTAMRVTGLVTVSVGGLSASIVEPSYVFKPAILANASSVVVAHNHPSGNPEPSRQDVAVTQQLVAAGLALGIPVHDHLIVTECHYTSLAERGLLR